MSQEKLLSLESKPTKIDSKPVKGHRAKASRTGWNLDREKKHLSKSLVPKLPVPRNQKSEALVRLGVTPEQLKASPEITSILKENRNGVKLAIDSLRFSTNEAVVTFLKKYDIVPKGDRERVSVEAIAISAGVDIRMLLAEIVLSMRERSLSAVKIIGVANHPDVVKRRVKFAKMRDGYRDRDKIDEMMGIIRGPQGGVFINKFINNNSDEGEDTPTGDVDEDYLFPDASEIQEKIQPLRQRLLEAGK